MRQTAEGTVHRLLTELETGGNVRFEDGIPSCLWSVSADLAHWGRTVLSNRGRITSAFLNEVFINDRLNSFKGTLLEER